MIAAYVYLIASALDILCAFLSVNRQSYGEALAWCAIAALNLTFALRHQKESTCAR